MAEIANLPDEVLLMIFSCLDPASVKNISLVSRQISDLNIEISKLYFFFCQEVELADQETQVLGVGLSETGQWELPGDHPESPD